MTSSIYALSVSAKSATTGVDETLLNSPISITSDMVYPGGGGILRLYFAVTTASPTVITVENNGNSKGTLNADNSNNIISNGYYRFDIDVEGGDSINLKSSLIVSTISFVRAHLVQFGA